MATQHNDGGPAFPRPSSEVVDSLGQHWLSAQEGMSLRAWLAGQALSGVCVTFPEEEWVKDGSTARELAKMVVQVADATIAELVKSK